MSKSTELQMHYHHDTQDGWLLSETGEEKDARWYPKKFVEQGERVRGIKHEYPVYEFSFATWLAEKEGLV